jgi:hypothetical protein
MADRANILSQYRIQWPTVNIFLLAMSMRWMASLLILGGLGWLFWSMVRDRVDAAAARKLWSALRPRRSPPSVQP